VPKVSVQSPVTSLNRRHGKSDPEAAARLAETTRLVSAMGYCESTCDACKPGEQVSPLSNQ
jgi:hypothetical protein